MSDSVRPHRQPPARLLCPWDSPGKNTGVGCHFLHQCMKLQSESEVAQSSSTLSDPMDYSLPGSSVHGIFQARVLEWGAIAFSENLLLPNAILSFLNNGNYKDKNLAKLSLVVQMVKNLPAMQETWVLSQGWEAPLEEDMEPHSSVLPGRILMDRGAWQLQSKGSQSQTRLSDCVQTQKKVLYISLKNANFLEKKMYFF